MADARGVRGLAVEAAERVAVVEERASHDLHGAAPAHAHVLGEIDAAHAALAEQALDVVAVGDDLADEVVPGDGGAERGAVGGTEADVGGVLGAALRTELRAGAGGTGPVAADEGRR